MATEFLSTFPQYGGRPVPSYLLDLIEADTNLDIVQLSVTDTSGSDPVTIFTNTYYPFGGRLTVEGLASVIESHMRRCGSSVADITLSIGARSAPPEAVLAIPVLYCDYVLPYPERLCGFLNTVAARRIHPGSMIALTVLLPDSGTSVHVCAVGSAPDGSNTSLSADIGDALAYDGGRTMIFKVDDIVDMLLALPETSASAISDICYFSVEYAGVSRTFYIVRDPQWMLFGFRNIFNAREFVDIVAHVNEKTEVSRTLAVASGHALQYNQSTARTHEVTTAALPLAEARAFDFLLNSRSVELYTAEASCPVLITEHTCEVDNDNESLASVKFTFRFTDGRPHILPPDIAPMLPSGGIFSQQFTLPFA